MIRGTQSSIFLFSRRLHVRLSSDFPEGAPFFNSSQGIQISKNTFERNETGDRAIDPLYPTFGLGFGGMLILRDPAYSKLVKCLTAALDDSARRPAIARAMMQSDLWGAYDQLYVKFLPDDERALGERRKAVLDLIGRLIRRVALTDGEIEALPNNYAAAVSQRSFPDVFAKNGGWIEVEWVMPRLHDSAAGYRRVSRVFLKPSNSPRDVNKFLNSLPNANGDATRTGLDGVALVTQLILIDSHGNLQPASLTVEAQARLFSRNHNGNPASSKVCEISRKLLLESQSGGLVEEDEGTPSYWGGYRFAEGQLRDQRWGEPVQAKLRTRCAACHGEDLKRIMTFSIARPPHTSVPAVKRLNATETEAADLDISVKRKQQDFAALFQYFR